MNRIWKYTLLIVFIVLVDQFSKGAAQFFVLAHQTGAESVHGSLLIGVSFFVLLWSFYRMIVKGRKTFLNGLPYVLIFAGFVGNLLDRLLFGHVVHIIRLDVLKEFGGFNLADVSIVLAVFLLVFNMLSPYRRKKELGRSCIRFF